MMCEWMFQNALIAVGMWLIMGALLVVRVVEDIEE